MQLTMVLTIPCAVGFAVLGKPIASMLYRHLSTSDNHMVAMFLLLGGISIVLYGVSSVLNGVLQGMGKVNIPVVSAAVALVLHVILLVVMLAFTRMGIYALILATAFLGWGIPAFNIYFTRNKLKNNKAQEVPQFDMALLQTKLTPEQKNIINCSRAIPDRCRCIHPHL